MSESRIVKYVPEATLAAFHADRHSRVKAVMGPYGSGKSTGDIMDLLMLAMEQEPFEGVRDVRTAVIRNTYPQLKSTVIKSWQEWIPDSVMKMVYDAPITGRMRQILPDGTILKWEVLFMALDRPDHVRNLKSLELTNAWVNEASELPWPIIEHLDGRIDRYPPKHRGGASRPCILMDTNAPDTDSKFFETFETLKPAGWTLYRQPPALIERGDFLVPNPAATYARFQNSGYGYWLNMAAGKSRDFVNVFIKGEYGTVFTGKPVYPEYRDGIHFCSSPLEVFPGLPLVLGMDFGLTPACAIMQLLPNGQLRIVDELISNGMGIRQFARDALRPHLANNYPGHGVVIYGDPAGLQRSQVSDEETCLNELAKQGFRATPAHTNSFVARREAVAGFLTTMTRDGEPAFVIGPKAVTVRKAFLGGYQFARVHVSGQEERFHDEPIKNMFSHVSDGVQYGALMVTSPVECKVTAQTVAARVVKKSGRRMV